MITKKGQIFGKINIFDFMMAVLIAVLIFIFFNNKISENKGVVVNQNLDTIDISYNLIIRNVREATFDAFSENESVYDYKLDNKMGEISKITKEPAKVIMKLLDGKYVNATIEDKYDITISVKSKAIQHNNGDLMVGKNIIIEGFEVGMSTQKCKCIAIIKEIKKT